MHKTDMYALNTDEYSGYVFAASTTWAYSYCLLHRSNVRIDAVYNLLPQRLCVILDILGLILLLYFMYVMTYHAMIVFWDSTTCSTRQKRCARTWPDRCYVRPKRTSICQSHSRNRIGCWTHREVLVPLDYKWWPDSSTSRFIWITHGVKTAEKPDSIMVAERSERHSTPVFSKRSSFLCRWYRLRFIDVSIPGTLCVFVPFAAHGPQLKCPRF